jgi:hypothetical protein
MSTAEAWFDRVAEEVTDEASQQWVVAAAERQKTDPQEWFS